MQLSLQMVLKKYIEAVVKDIDTFSLLSGLKLNRKKTFIMRCGSLKHTNCICCKEKQFNWTSEKAQTLGMTFTNDKNEISIHNVNIFIDGFFIDIISSHYKRRNNNSFVLGVSNKTKFLE